MTIGVDRQTSSLVVSSSEALFVKVESLVKERDEAAKGRATDSALCATDAFRCHDGPEFLSAMFPASDVEFHENNEQFDQRQSRRGQTTAIAATITTVRRLRIHLEVAAGQEVSVRLAEVAASAHLVEAPVGVRSVVEGRRQASVETAAAEVAAVAVAAAADKRSWVI
jgi:hypothetical protein